MYMTFENLNLIEPILKALRQEGYTSPTPIQEQSIPILLQGKDLLGCAQTGTGKTAAFSIPILQKLYKTDHRKGIKALVLTPTRELAIQIGESFEAYGRYTGLKHAVIFGGVGQKPQTDALRSGIQILVATPGRLLDLISQGFISLSSLDFFVLDEAAFPCPFYRIHHPLTDCGQTDTSPPAYRNPTAFHPPGMPQS